MIFNTYDIMIIFLNNFFIGNEISMMIKKTFSFNHDNFN